VERCTGLAQPERVFAWTFNDAFEAFSAQRAELLEALDSLATEDWGRTATVTVPPAKVYAYSLLFYGDWMARHERSHLKHMARVLRDVAVMEPK
jgi:hypothetical protein